MAITGAHTLFYTSEVDAFRAVMRDALELPIAAEDRHKTAFVTANLPII